MKKIRIELNIKQKDLAKRLRITHSTLSNYEAGRRKNPRIDFVKRFINGIII